MTLKPTVVFHALCLLSLAVTLLILHTACNGADHPPTPAAAETSAASYELTPPVEIAPDDWPFIVESPQPPDIERTVEVTSDVELDAALANGAKTHIIVRYSPVEMKRAWLFRLDGRNHDCILEFADRDTEVKHRLEIHPLARRCRIVGGRFPSIRFGTTENGQQPQDITLDRVVVEPSAQGDNAVDLAGQRVLFARCRINANRKYAIWSDHGLSHAVFEHCRFGESREESPVRMYNCRQVVFSNCLFENRVDLKPDDPRKIIKAAARIMASDQIGYLACTFVGSGLWINMPPGPGRTDDNGAVHVEGCRFLHEAATNLPIEAWGTKQLTVKNCQAVSTSRRKFMSTASDVTLNPASGANEFMHADRLPDVSWLDDSVESSPAPAEHHDDDANASATEHQG
jgi:hypothetical protein